MIHSWITMNWTKRIDRCILKVHHVSIVNIGWPCCHVTIIKFWRCPNRDLPWLTAVKTVVKWYRLEIKQDNLSSSLIDSCFVFNLISSHGNDSNKILHLTIYKIIPFLFYFFSWQSQMNQIRVNQEVLCSLFDSDTVCDQWIHNFSKYSYSTFL